MSPIRQKLSPREVAEIWGVTAAKVRAWIRSGQLHAVNVGMGDRGKPTWRVNKDDLDAFEARRSNRKPKSGAPRAPRRARTAFTRHFR